MSKLKKHILFIYLAFFMLVIGLVARMLILPISNHLYQYVPADSDIVIEVNAVNFIKEVGYQWLYEPGKFNQEHPLLEEDEDAEKLKDFGIDPFSKIIIYNEEWADESLWFVVLSCNNVKKFTAFMADILPNTTPVFDDNVAILQVNSSKNQADVSEHLANIVAKKVKSITANPVIKKEFSNQHEINIYIKALKSDFVTDGYLNVNFNDNQIDLSGYFHPIGSTELQPIAYQTDSAIGLSLRSSLNLLNTIYLFNDTKLDYLPDYKQLALDYDGVNLLTNNDVIPVTSFPNISLLIDVYDDKDWLKYLDASVEDGSLLMSNDTIMINSEVKAKIRYDIANQQFKLFQKPITFAKSPEINQMYFDLKMHPQQIIDKMYFSEDPANPPKLVATQIIKIIKSILSDFNYLKTIEEINFSIEKDPNSTDYISRGHIIYQNKTGHSTIETFFLVRNFLQTVDNFIR